MVFVFFPAARNEGNESIPTAANDAVCTNSLLFMIVGLGLSAFIYFPIEFH